MLLKINDIHLFFFMSYILLVVYLKIEVGNYVTRKSYNNDILFKVISIKNDKCYLKGCEVRLLADSLISDLTLVDENNIDNYFVGVSSVDNKLERSDYFYLPGKILHIDGDSDFLERCLKYYKDSGVLAIGKKIKEDKIYEQIFSLLRQYNPDIVIITGHDSFFKDNHDVNDLKNYKNSENFIKAIKEARKFEKSHEKLIIIAGACQSNYEALIKAGANFASSPKRINIHALDPAIIATNLSLTARNEQIDLKELLSKTRNGKDGIGGLQCNGIMYVGYPR